MYQPCTCCRPTCGLTVSLSASEGARIARVRAGPHGPDIRNPRTMGLGLPENGGTT